MRKFLLYSSALAVFGFSDTVLAACIQTPSCSSLGYDSSTSCEGGLKCPFGEAWNCKLNEKITELEKIIEEIKSGCCQSNCQVGDILYSDMTCDPDVIPNKTPIGIVFDRSKNLAIGLSNSYAVWSTESFDIPDLPNITSSAEAKYDYRGKEYTDIALKYCKANNKSCPAFEYAYNYTTEGTKAGDWYLPSVGELYKIYENISELNSSLKKVASTTQIYFSAYWSSTEDDINRAYNVNMGTGSISIQKEKTVSFYIHPVLTFPVSSSSGGEQTPGGDNCKVGDILYSDRNCTTNAVAGETAIGVVFDRLNRKALALNVASPAWSKETFDVPGIPNVTSEADVVKDMNGKEYTKAAQEFCSQNGYSCPAFDYVASYKTEGTNAGDWYLPSLGELKTMYDNEALINAALRKAGGFILSSTYTMSSSEYSSGMMWDIAYFANNATPITIGRGYKYNSGTQIRPVLVY